MREIFLLFFIARQRTIAECIQVIGAHASQILLKLIPVFWQTFKVLVKTTVYPNTFWLRIYTKKGEKVVKVCLHFDSLQFDEFFTNKIILIFSIQNLLGHLVAVK